MFSIATKLVTGRCGSSSRTYFLDVVGGVVVVVVVVVGWCWCGGDVRVVLVVLLAVMVALVKISLSFSSCKQKVPSSLKYRLVGPV